jgi:hypothetical protein
MKTILHVLGIGAGRAQMFAALTTADGLSRWWTTQVAGGAGEGGVIDFTFDDPFNADTEVTGFGQQREWRGGAWPAISPGQTALRFELEGDAWSLPAGLRDGAGRRRLRNLQLQLGLLAGQPQALLRPGSRLRLHRLARETYAASSFEGSPISIGFESGSRLHSYQPPS